MIQIDNLSKTLTLQNQGGAAIRVIKDATLSVARAAARNIIRLRWETLGSVSQFLRVAPRVPTVDVVAKLLRPVGIPSKTARERADARLARLYIPQSLWSLSHSTFLGGAQPRVNIARGFVHNDPARLLDDPTASPDATNRDIVLALIKEAKARGDAIIGIFHDKATRARICDREIDVSRFTGARVA